MNTPADSTVNPYPQAFLDAVAKVLAHEGGYSNSAADAGGRTKFGISEREYPQLDIQSLTREQAIRIYYHDWWQRYRYADLPVEIGTKLFDLAVNMGPADATRCLQRALRACRGKTEEDGVLGSETRKAAAGADKPALMAALRSEAACHYRLIAARGTNPGGHEFLAGWLNRAYE
jgi:lysozyme family protein